MCLYLTFCGYYWHLHGSAFSLRNPDGTKPENLGDSAEVKAWKQRQSEIKRDIDSAQKIVDEYINAVAEFGTETTNLAETYNQSSTSYSGDFIDVEAEKKKFKSARDEFKKEYELGEIDAAAYYSKLESLRDKYLR